MAEWAPVARSPIPAAAPVEVRHGWEVSVRTSDAPLRLSDQTPLAKVLVRGDGLDVPNGRAERDPHGTLVVGSGPDEWLLVGPVGTEAALAERAHADAPEASVVEQFSHGRALVRLTGADAPKVLAKLCALDLGAMPDGTALRTSVAKLATDVVRDDLGGSPSYLLHCERSSGRYLHETLLDAGAEFGIEPVGFSME